MLSKLDLDANDTVADFFAGLGTFARAIAPQVKQVHAYETSPAMVERGRSSIAVDNIHYHRADLFDETFTLPQQSGSVNKWVLDPPRAGALHLCQLADPSRVSLIVYVSCHPASMLRDADVLLEKGYKLVSVEGFDMFHHTSHLEMLAVFST